MTDEQESKLFETLDRLERNSKLALHGLQLCLSELGIRKEMANLIEQIDGAVSESRDTMPCDPPSTHTGNGGSSE